MHSPSTLPLEAREAAGRLLWQRLLAEPPEDDDNLESEPDGASEDEAT